MRQKEIGQCLLQYLLDKRQMTQADLSRKTGISTQQISDYINNRRVMSLKNARIISRAIGCIIDDLYDWKI
jgi:transcriptional regulator with XRE-family HTH domain